MKIVVIPPKDKLDYLAETIIEGLYKNKIDIYSSDTGNGISPLDVYTDEEIIEHSKDCDYIFVIWGKIRNHFPGPKYHLVDKINKFKLKAFLLHTVSIYPTPDGKSNITYITHLRNKFESDSIKIGYSGHEIGYAPSILATLQGAKMIE